MIEFKYLFEPVTIGNMKVPNRICHIPTDISSSHIDGPVSERDIHHRWQESMMAKKRFGSDNIK